MLVIPRVFLGAGVGFWRGERGRSVVELVFGSRVCTCVPSDLSLTFGVCMVWGTRLFEFYHRVFNVEAYDSLSVLLYIFRLLKVESFLWLWVNQSLVNSDTSSDVKYGDSKMSEKDLFYRRTTDEDWGWVGTVTRSGDKDSGPFEDEQKVLYGVLRQGDTLDGRGPP